MKSLICAVLAIAALCPASARSGAPIWTESNVVGLDISLEDPDIIEDLHFVKGGYLSAGFGRKNLPTETPGARGVSVAAPLLMWSLENDVLRFGVGTPFSNQFTLVSRDSSSIVVHDRDNKELRFRIVGQADVRPQFDH